MCVVIDLVRQLPQELWFTKESMAHDTNFTQNLLDLVNTKTLLILDRGFYDFTFFARLVDQGVHLMVVVTCQLIGHHSVL